MSLFGVGSNPPGYGELVGVDGLDVLTIGLGWGDVVVFVSLVSLTVLVTGVPSVDVVIDSGMFG